MASYPDDEYMLRIARVVYAVGSLEWLVLGSIPSYEVPPALDVASLTRKTTKKIGEALTNEGHLLGVADESFREYLRRGGEILMSLADRRNAVVHARPAQYQEGGMDVPRLYRWRVTPEASETYFITDELLDDLLADIESASRELHDMRAQLSTG